MRLIDEQIKRAKAGQKVAEMRSAMSQGYHREAIRIFIQNFHLLKWHHFNQARRQAVDIRERRAALIQ